MDSVLKTGRLLFRGKGDSYMTVYEYRTRLMSALADYDAVEVVNAANYYAELIVDAEDPDDQMNRLGPPEQLAQMIIESGGWDDQRRQRYYDQRTAPQYAGQGYGEQADRPMTSGRVAALICTFPFWLTVYILIITLFIVLFALAIGLPISIVAVIINGIVNLPSSVPTGMMFFSIALLLAGLFTMVMSTLRSLAGGAGGILGKFTRFLFGTRRQENGLYGQPKKSMINKAALVIGAVMFVTGTVGTVITGAMSSAGVREIVQEDAETFDIALGSEFSQANIKLNAGRLIITESSENRTILKCENVVRESLKVDDSGELNIKYDPDFLQIIDFDNIEANDDIVFTLCLPEKRYKEINAELALGNIYIESVNADNIHIENSAGDTDINRCNADEISIESALGNLNINGLTADSATIKCSTGNNVEISDSNMKNVDLDCDVGNVIFENCRMSKLKADVDSGDVTFRSAQISKEADIDINYGDVEIELTNGKYSVDARADVGDVMVSGTNSSGGVPVKIRCDAGNIEVTIV